MKKPRSRDVKFPTKMEGDRKSRHFEAHFTPSDITNSMCSCGGKIIRSFRTGILHKRCFICRYLMMIYGPNITVERIDPKKAK